MIVILKRDDLPSDQRGLSVDGLELAYFDLSPKLVDQSEMIVFVEGSDIKFLKQLPEIQSKSSLDVLIGYITSTAPETKERIPFSLKRFGQRRKRESK